MNKYLGLLIFALAVALIVAGSLWCASCRDWFQTKPDTAVITGSGDWQDKIKIVSPQPGEAVASPLVVTGTARGVWFFEASFPIVLVDWDGLIIAEGVAQAQSDPATGEVNWMTEDYVPFMATLTFTRPSYSDRGTLILKKDNPSGLPEHDAALEVPVKFK
ncbi:MAG: Gmad2 immunoglobulin-like domain-containing protein [bacterium]|nr:Gmad2 immunoglobulin-like domain-containing protein [bacterium]